MKTNSAATASELREFLKALRGKTPTEMLGVVASSSLFRSLVIATIGTVVLIALLTIVPFAWAEIFDKTDDAPPLPAKEEPAAEPKKADEPSIDTPTTTPADTLGIGETKVAPAKSNPLENSNDDLLKDLE